MYKLNTAHIKASLGIEANGRVQKIIDNTVVHHLKQTMPVDSGIMMANTRIVKPGLIKIETPYAHYMNEGILYVMPSNGKGAYFSPNFGYWSKPGIKKVPSGKSLNYHGGADRGAHFVERTLNGHYQDILNAAKKEVGKK